ncbi:MAG: DNA polymerase IV [Thermoanaerobaculia bacterium]
MTPSGIRKILHVDMDAFYASVEQRDDPTLRGQPVAVGGDPKNRGVVAAASYEARAFGVRSALPMAQAVRLCPQLRIVPPDFPRYRAVSSQVFALFRGVTPLVEPLSLDEAYLDVTVNAWDEPLGSRVARRLKQMIKEETGLTASAGVAPNLFLAKIASGFQKPDGLTVIPPEKVEEFLNRLPVDALWGVGPVTARKLRALGFERLVDLRRADETVLQATVGKFAGTLIALSNGIDHRAVVPDRPSKSCGTESTYSTDLTDRAEMAAQVRAMAESCARWLAKQLLLARTVTLKVRYADFQTITRSQSRVPETRATEELAERAVSLLQRTDAGERAVRLLGVSVHNFVPEGGEAREALPSPQLDLTV